MSRARHRVCARQVAARDGHSGVPKLPPRAASRPSCQVSSRAFVATVLRSSALLRLLAHLCAPPGQARGLAGSLGTVLQPQPLIRVGPFDCICVSTFFLRVPRRPLSTDLSACSSEQASHTSPLKPTARSASRTLRKQTCRSI